MRILHITQYFLPALRYQERYLAAQQAAAGHKVRIVTSTKLWPQALYHAALSTGFQARDVEEGMHVEFGPETVRLPVVYDLSGRLVLRGIEAAVAEFRPDVVHAHGYLTPSTFAAARLQRRYGFRLVVDEHQLGYQARRGAVHAAERALVAALARRIVLPSVHRLVGVAEGVRDWLVEGYGCPPGLVDVVPLGADTQVFCPDAEAGRRVRTQLGVGQDELVALYSGKIAPHKRVGDIIRALRSTGITLVAVGPAEPAELSRLREAASLSRVRFVYQGAVIPEELNGFFNAADVCVWPADCTISHLEAASAGRPIVIPAEAGIQERISRGNGLAVDIGDVEALRSGLLTLMGDEERRQTMGTAGRRLVEEQFSWAIVAQRFETIYKSSR